ncbi:acyl-CoA/acyl-ACP dehydrogenase [Curtobacterium sp. PhB115]|uniref:acyl-CoA/acyl-ACP dehydrogenase n=1 Tax=Curtobacterium sp. PhB115 TaxID=2485173 RepID=UPI000F99C5FE|nr:acyl-CoA/acyl-ACP dehydrogenase [Curtobacterium sp. PhB115]ROP64199.1 alkylation response protein AidB-like acyl-CoA dehydrogenase [Curtobacterium sp. PhB115]
MLRSSAWPASASGVDTALIERSAGRLGAAPADRLAFARSVASTTPPLSAGSAGGFFATLAAVAAADVALARTVEPHLDATGILAQAGVSAPEGSTWGVFAAEGPGVSLTAGPAGSDGSGGSDGSDGSVVLDGTKPWCSLASTLSHALVTATVGDARQLFAVDLRQDGVTAHDEAWVARGMPDVPSGPVDFDHVPAVPVGEPGWYLGRPGFAWGGIGVAACWWGGAVGLARVLRATAEAHPDSELLQAALGATVADLADAEDALADAASRIDGRAHDDVDWSLLAQLVRSRVRRAVDAVRTRVVATIGPAPLTSDPAVAARVADLELYVLQDHGERDLARIGRKVLERGGVAW